LLAGDTVSREPLGVAATRPPANNRIRDTRGQQGQTLVLALIAFSVGIIILTVALSALSSSSKLHAAQLMTMEQEASMNAGVEFGVHRLQSDPTLRGLVTANYQTGAITTTLPFTVTAPNNIAPVVTLTLMDPNNYDNE
jgi:hypothetical protein